MKRKKRNYWSKEMCKIEALKYKSRSRFKKKSPGAFSAAYKNKWLDEVCLHMNRVGNRFKRLVYSYEFSDNHVYVGLTHDMEERDNKHKRDKRSKVYQHIKKANLLPKLICSDYMPVEQAVELERKKVKEYKKKEFNILNIATPGGVGGGYIKWTFEKCAKEALKFKTRREFARNSNSAYNSARRYGWLNKICKHMSTVKKMPIGYWTKERCMHEALKYKTKKEFYDKCGGAYSASFRNGWLNDVCKHMLKVK